MHDPLLVGSGEPTGHLERELGALAGGRTAGALEQSPERLPVEQLVHDVGHTLVRAHVVHGDDVGVIQGPGDVDLELESPEPVGTGRKGLGQDLDRDLPPDAGVPRTIDLPHAPGRDRGQDLVGPQLRTRIDCHGRPAALVTEAPL